MKILVLNCGSSSLKYQLINMENEEVMAKGYLEKIGLPDSFLTHTVNGEKHKIEKKIDNHEEGIKLVVAQLLDSEYGVIKDLKEIDAVGHRVVHGGEKFSGSVLITDDVVEAMKECIPLAPLHNPAGITGIEACQKALPGVPMVGVFDTAFHQTLPEKAYMYAIPYEYYEKYGIRKYGFHGTSHKFVSRRVAEVMNKPIDDLKIISCHLGQGASLCAIEGGKSIETTMGLTPLAGVPMGSRSGDIDPSIITFLMKNENLSSDEMDKILNKQSGKLGLSGVSIDDRDIETAAKEGNERAQLAIDNFVYQVAGFIGKLAVQMKGVDVITFTAGIGENGIDARRRICDYLGVLGVKIDEEKNDCRGKEIEISTPDSKVKVYVIPTNEELMIARDTKEIVCK
ncbi:acetate/propionate family kinase [Holdemanella sp.]|uniref:acetate/propionate family kinase n=1 Tax=Holdemanella sp. TaxID=1971762 RepID=UPI003AF07139